VTRYNSIATFDAQLQTKLRAAGYDDFSYFSAPFGYALATRIERIDEGGYPLSGSLRWATELKPIPPQGFIDYVNKVLHDEEGYFRIFVFVITRDTSQPAETPALFIEAQRWATTGCKNLPQDMLAIKIAPDHIFYVLSYVFSARKGKEAKQMDAFAPASEQLKKVGFEL
jgi:hypothetical protein